METLGRTRIVNYNTEIEVRALTATRLASERRVADLTSRRAAEFGIDNAYSASADYRPSQELAALLFDAGFEGVRYKIRHDPAQGLEALALFHSAPGEHPELFATQKASPIPIDVIELAEREFGITVQSTTTLP